MDGGVWERVSFPLHSTVGRMHEEAQDTEYNACKHMHVTSVTVGGQEVGSGEGDRQGDRWGDRWGGQERGKLETGRGDWRGTGEW